MKGGSGPKPWLPKVLYGFPVEDAGTSSAATRVEDGRRGIALIIAIMIISVMMLFTSDLILSSQVNLTLATQARDNIKAEYMAKSALNAASLLLASDFAYVLFQAQQNPKAALTTAPGDIWSVMNGLPIGGETLEMMNQFQSEFGLNGVMDSGVIDELKLFDGSFTLDVSDESSKINVNDCYYQKCTQVTTMLKALFACPAEKAFLETKKVTGEELAARIQDYIKSKAGADPASGYNDKNEPYLKRKTKQMAKNAPLDSVDELRMVEGWDEEIHAVFSPYLTVFPHAQITTDSVYQMNINSAPRALLVCLFDESRGDCAEKSALAFKKRANDPSAQSQGGQPMPDILKDLVCYNGAGVQATDTNNKADWFRQYSMTFRVEAAGNVENSQKHLTAVLQRVMPDPKKNEKSTVRILYWKLN